MNMENLVELTNDAHFVIDMMYASLKNNMTGVAVYEEIGFGNRALVHKDVWAVLQKVFPYLEEKGLKLKVYDAYRPPVAHRRLKEIIPEPGFFASSPEVSNHCHATAIDVCFCLLDGTDLVYPTKVDAFDETYAKQVQQGVMAPFFEYLKKARHDFVETEDKDALKNRQELLEVMEAAGFERCKHEWWHYDLPGGKDETHPMIEF